jgi:hypothetical protein
MYLAYDMMFRRSPGRQGSLNSSRVDKLNRDFDEFYPIGSAVRDVDEKRDHYDLLKCTICSSSLCKGYEGRVKHNAYTNSAEVLFFVD